MKNCRPSDKTEATQQCVILGGEIMAGKRRRIPKYGTVEINGHTYYRTNITDSEGKQRTLYAKTREELYDKELDTLSQMDDDRQRRKSPTVADYCEKWLVMQSAHVRTTTLTDYKSMEQLKQMETDGTE